MNTFARQAMNFTESASQASLTVARNRRLEVGGRQVTLDAGRVYVVCWPDTAVMAANIGRLCNLTSPTIRHSGGALIADLSLQDNLMAEPALQDGRLPTQLMPEIETLFRTADCPLASATWPGTFPEQADARSVMQVQVGRAMVADPDLLVMDATRWDDFVLSPLRFSQSFVTQFPWRTLIWATHDTGRADKLRVLLEEFSA